MRSPNGSSLPSGSPIPLALLDRGARPPKRPRLVIALLAVVGAAVPAGLQAQAPEMRSAQEWCADGSGSDRNRERVCEVREERFAAGSRLSVDGGANGGIRVHGWDQREVLVRARVEARSGRLDDARTLLEEVVIHTDNGRVRSSGPRTDRRESWWVSYEVFVPRSMDLDLETTNGGIRVENVSGAVRFDATNGGVVLEGLAGDVRGRTTNGGLQVRLVGDRWEGAGLDVETTNGGVTVQVPENYSAHLQAATTNGGMDVEFPVTIQGRIGRRLNATLGEGGAPIRVTTTNGRVRVVRP
jgi:hypothetical protein